MRNNIINWSGKQILTNQDELEDLEYNFSKNIGEEDCIEFLKDCGYTITDNSHIDSLDSVDENMLYEITKKFLESSWEERDLIYKKLGL